MNTDKQLVYKKIKYKIWKIIARLFKKRILKRFGNVYSCYLAYSSDDNVRYASSSGGFCKSFLWYLIKSDEKIDEAIITASGSSTNPLNPEIIATDKKDDIFSTKTNSVYSPSNPLPVLKNLDKNKNYVFVGLPCHLLNLRALQRKDVAKNVKFVLGLICHHTPKRGYLKQYLKKINVNEKNVEKIEYRGHGWPGKFTAHLKDGSEKSGFSFFPPNLSNAPKYCESCTDINREADIVACDPWGIVSRAKESKGKTLIVCKTERADRLVVDAAKKKYITLESSNIDSFFRSQGLFLFFKILRKWRKK